MTGQFTGTDAGNANLTITDGTTTGFGINKITVSGGDLTSASNGEAVIDTSGAGGGGTVTSVILSTGVIGLTVSAGTTQTITTTGTFEIAGTLVVANGGTGATTTGGARTNLGVAIGTDVQAYSAVLNNLSSLGGATDAFIVGSGTAWAKATPSSARASMGAAASGANSDITSITGLTTDLTVAQGGTGAGTAGGARTNLSAASSGANSDITSITGLTTPLTIAQGGTGQTSATAAMTALSSATFQQSGASPNWGITVVSAPTGGADPVTNQTAIISLISALQGMGVIQ